MMEDENTKKLQKYNHVNTKILQIYNYGTVRESEASLIYNFNFSVLVAEVYIINLSSEVSCWLYSLCESEASMAYNFSVFVVEVYIINLNSEVSHWVYYLWG